MFPQLLGKVAGEPNQLRALHDKFKENGVWVSDQEFEDALKNKALYRSRDLPFARMVLAEIDKLFQTHGQFPDYSTVNTIEHMIPQTLDEDWQKYLGRDAEDEHLPTVIDTLGNLCLLSRTANSTAGQDPFESKKAMYSELTALARQIKQYDGHWGIQAVRDRSKDLAKKALEVWSSGNA